ncbi:MAG TPA: hypothetical protein VEF55_13365 [Candidatus Binatia bacterium]|nr:hypothetical protein [Candidatus Binatia bacterium]
MDMDDAKAFSASLAGRGARIFCGDPDDFADLDPDELNAVHLCKHEMLAAMHRLYDKVEVKTADKLIRKYLGKVIDENAPSRRTKP